MKTLLALGVLTLVLAGCTTPRPPCDALFNAINADVALYNQYNEAAADMMVAGYDIVKAVNGPLGTEDWPAFNRGVDAFNAAVDRTIDLEEQLVASQVRVWDAYYVCVGE